MVNNIKVSATVLVAILLVFCVCSTVCAGTYSGGTGTANDPYLIATAAALQAIGDPANSGDWDKHFLMTANIDLSAYDGQDGKAAFNIIAPYWIPPRDDRNFPPNGPPFTGTFDGNEHVIYNFSYTATSAGYIGLFGNVGNFEQGFPPISMPGTIKNVGLDNASVSASAAPGASSYVGLLAGYILDSTISKCYVHGVVGGSNAVVGGLVGVSEASTITECYSNIQSGGGTVGGLVGENGGMISNCYSNADIGGGRAGGLVGKSEMGMISNCYATGNIGDSIWSGEEHGGLVGLNMGSIEYCYSTVQVGTATYAGGLVGHDGSLYPGPDMYTACFWDADLNPSLSDAGDFIGGIDLTGVISETTVNMQMRTTFTSVGWDFAVETINGEDDIWTIDEGAAYPDLGLDEYVGGVGGEPNDLDIYYVDYSVLGHNNGSSWADAFTEFQSALDAAVAGDEIRVADGTYKPSVEVGGSGERYRTFQLKTSVTVRGGFAGWGAVDPNDRNFELYETILSGDLNGNDNPNTPVEDLRDDPSRADNCYHVFYHPEGLGLDPNAVLDGFTITAGSNSQNGAGMYNSNSSPTVTNCTFKWNCAEWGAGMANWNSSPKVTGCKFENNAAGGGGGMNNMENSNPILIDCTFSNNFGSWMGGGMVNGYAGLHGSANPTLINCTFNGNSAERGGGMYNAEESNPTVTGCTFSGNSAEYQGSGMFNISSSPTVTGCTFSSNSPIHGFGGGMYNNNSNPEVMGCTFVGNSCDAGGGMYNYQDSSPIVSDCTFTGNLTMASGSGMFNEDSSNPTVTNCTFSNNSSLIGGGGGMFNVSSGPEVISYIFSDNSAHFEGGGMYNYNSDLTVTDCTFSGNSAVHGGGMCNELSDAIITNCTFSGNSADLYGGGMYNDSSSPAIMGCHFVDNSALGDGGGIYNYSSSNATASSCTFSGNSAHRGGGVFNHSSDPKVVDCIFTGNSANMYGGGMDNSYSSNPTIAGCTFTGNSAGSLGGGMDNFTSSPTITNCILWGNIASSNGNEIFSESSTTVVSYCDIKDSGGSGAWDGSLGTDGGGNIDVDPEFVDPNGVDEVIGTGDDNLRLSSGSACIDAGDNGAVTEVTDLDGHSRIVDGDCDLTATVDMGAYEFDWLYLGDFAGGCDVDLSDFAVLAENWQGSNAGMDIVPYLEGDGVIDLGELMVLAEHWLEGIGPAPLVTGWQTAVVHGGAGVFISDIENWFVECRVNGVTKLYVCFDQAMDTSMTGPALITIDGVIGGLQAEPCSIVWETDSCMTVTLYSALVDDDIYTITVSDSLLSAGGTRIGGDRDIIIVALAGDADSNTLVNSLDISAVNEYVSEPISVANCRYDVNCNGLINFQDLLAVYANEGHGGIGTE